MKNFILFSAAILLLGNSLRAQVAINKTGASPAPTSALDIDMPGKGLLMPRMSEAVRDTISNPAVGLMIFNTTTNCVNMYTGSSWRQSCFECSFVGPTAGISGNVCEGETINLTATLISGATYSWTGPGGFNSADQNPVISNADNGDNGTYSVTATLNGCTSASSSVNVVVNTLPTTPIASSNSPVCEGDSLHLNVSSTSGATYSWSGPNGFTAGVQSPSIANITTAGAGSYQVIADLNGCTALGSTTVVVNTAPASPTAGNGGPLCEGGDLQLTASTVSGATYSWTGPDGFSSTDQNPLIGNVTTANAGVYSVVAIVNGCTSSAATTNAVINANSGYRYFRLTVTGTTSSGTSQAQVAELQFYDGSNWVTNDMTSMTTPSPKVVEASNYSLPGYYGTAPPWKIFDGQGPTNHYSAGVLNTGSNNFPYWISIDFGECNGFTPTQYSISTSSYSDSGGTYRPTSWTIEGSTDNSNWSLLDSRSGISFSGGETKTYSL